MYYLLLFLILILFIVIYLWNQSKSYSYPSHSKISHKLIATGVTGVTGQGTTQGTTGPNKAMVMKENLELIKISNQQEKERKSKIGDITVATFEPNKFLPYTYNEIIQNFTGLNIPENFIENEASPKKTQMDGSNNEIKYQRIDFEKIPDTGAKKDIFYGVSPKLFNKARDQDKCGSCWAFSAVTVVEAQIVKKFLSESPPYLSIQYYLDCVKQARGCEGGFPIFVYEKILEDGFVPWDYIIPYTATTDVCIIPLKKFPVNIKGVIAADKNDIVFFKRENIVYAEIFNNIELTIPDSIMIEKIKKILFTYGPLSVLIYVDEKLPFFSNGIYLAVDKKDGIKQNPNHAVVIGGYGINVYGQDYWIIRNSWGSEWAEDGYIQLSTKSPISGITMAIFDEIPPLLPSK